jgi:hypothetical protein
MFIKASCDDTNWVNAAVMQERLNKLPEVIEAAKLVISHIDADALLTYYGIKTDLRQGASSFKA